MKNHKVLICIPAYNEEENIEAVLDDIKETAGDKYGILVVDDGSADRTRELCNQKGVMTISHIFNMGYGAALKTSYKYAAEHGYDYVIQMDADGQHDCSNIDKIYEQISTTDSDIVIGSRFLSGSGEYKFPLAKKIAVFFFNRIIKLSSKMTITDPTSGLQGLNRKAITFYARFNRFSIDFPDANMIIQMAMNGFKISEFPAVMHPRSKGESMHSGIIKPFKYMFKMSVSILSVCIRESMNQARERRLRK